MSFEIIILLSLIQGITEFLPVSSSAHLMLFPFLAKVVDQGVVTDIFAHIGSLLAVILFYRNDLKSIILSIFSPKKNKNMLYCIIIATLPIVFVGLLFLIFKIDIRNPKIVIYTSIIFGLMLFITDKFGKKKYLLKNLSLKDAFYIGVAQTLASIPGVSRSGITTTCGLSLGYKREDTLKFSFLISIPAIILVGCGGILKFIVEPQPIDFSSMIYVMLFSFIFSFMAIRFMVYLLKHSSFKPFAIYRILLGIFLYLYLK